MSLNLTCSPVFFVWSINQTNDKERDLFERIISRQQDEIDYLKGIVSVFKK